MRLDSGYMSSACGLRATVFHHTTCEMARDFSSPLTRVAFAASPPGS
jgi:hypothetical protein